MDRRREAKPTATRSTTTSIDTASSSTSASGCPTPFRPIPRRTMECATDSQSLLLETRLHMISDWLALEVPTDRGRDAMRDGRRRGESTLVGTTCRCEPLTFRTAPRHTRREAGGEHQDDQTERTRRAAHQDDGCRTGRDFRAAWPGQAEQAGHTSEASRGFEATDSAGSGCPAESETCRLGVAPRHAEFGHPTDPLHRVPCAGRRISRGAPSRAVRAPEQDNAA